MELRKNFEKAVACVYCGKLIYDDEDVYQVRRITADGQEMYSPTCSITCAKLAQEENAKIHRTRLYDVEHQCFQRMSVKEWLM